MEGGCGLPDHIIFCILLHLSVKCLIRFKTESKKWNALITDSCFVRQHHSLQSSSKLLLARTAAHIYPIPLTFDAISKDLCAHPNVYKPFEQSIPNADSIWRWLMGPYYGVFCFAVFCYRGPVRITLCNIATRESKDLPCLNYSNLVRSYAFGFGCVDNHTAGVPEFKVVRLAYVTSEGSELKCLTHVYTSATNSWKSTEPCQSFTNQQGIEMNGVIHWLARSLTETNILNFNFILTFNLKAEVFGRIEVPNISSDAFLTKQNYQFLSLISTTQDYYDDIWVMRGGSWVKQATIGPPGIDTRALIGNWRRLYFDESGVLVRELNSYWLNLGLLPWEVCCDGWRMVMPLGMRMPLGEANRCAVFVTGFFDFAESLVSFNFIE